LQHVVILLVQFICELIAETTIIFFARYSQFFSHVMRSLPEGEKYW